MKKYELNGEDKSYSIADLFCVTALHADTWRPEDISRSIWPPLFHLAAKDDRHFIANIYLEIKAGSHIIGKK